MPKQRLTERQVHLLTIASKAEGGIICSAKVSRYRIGHEYDPHNTLFSDDDEVERSCKCLLRRGLLRSREVYTLYQITDLGREAIQPL